VSLGGDRALADVLGGYDGGRAFWLAALAALEQACVRSRDRTEAFSSYPPSELRRFLADVDDALGLAVIAVGVQEILNGDDDPRETAASRRAEIDALLLRRVRQARNSTKS
jgi:hypothetical protein